VQRQETDQHAVQVMTVHRAKGLEAWVVFVVGGIGFMPKSDDIAVIHDAAGKRVAVLKGSDVPVGATGHEDQRLAYVALTRARARVYLPVLPPKSKQPKPRGGWLAVYGAMHDALTDLHATGRTARAPAAGAAELPSNVIAFPSTAPMVDAWPPARPPSGELDAASVALPPPPPAVREPDALGARTGFVVTSYSRLRRDAGELDVTAVTAEDRSKRAPAPDELPGGASTGQLIHAVLEHADFGERGECGELGGVAGAGGDREAVRGRRAAVRGRSPLARQGGGAGARDDRGAGGAGGETLPSLAQRAEGGQARSSSRTRFRIRRWIAAASSWRAG
jgi:exodeoxyribonuclease V beta subunit